MGPKMVFITFQTQLSLHVLLVIAIVAVMMVTCVIIVTTRLMIVGSRIMDTINLAVVMTCLVGKISMVTIVHGIARRGTVGPASLTYLPT